MQNEAPTPTAQEFAILKLRVTALEEFLAQMATILECERKGFTADRMNAWLDMTTAKMQMTKSATLEEVQALRRLQRIVVG
ncbi:hypothetical protein [Comamonas avium]|uniref:Uncharacterized protein n=1 Tax=Comamonas avium TaxID=2762231 RepID=A0ABR8SDG4_9BURK|nr:hypothetical protein [Comamonas avium]MBD7961521.1 hypothetical protein [Comamonas avium]